MQGVHDLRARGLSPRADRELAAIHVRYAPGACWSSAPGSGRRSLGPWTLLGQAEQLQRDRSRARAPLARQIADHVLCGRALEDHVEAVLAVRTRAVERLTAQAGRDPADPSVHGQTLFGSMLVDHDVRAHPYLLLGDEPAGSSYR